MSTDVARKQASFVVRYALQSFGLIVLLAVLIRIFLLSSYVMSGSSMLPGIWPGDFLVGLKWGLHEPRRGEIVILRCPTLKERVCLKRVVGLAGDRIEFKDGQLVINGRPAIFKPLGEFGQESVGGAGWPVWPAVTPPTNREALVVPPQSVYVLNDKRADLEDSRNWGPLSTDLFEARAARIWLSLDWLGRDGQTRAWPRVRWARLFRSIN